MRRKAVIGAVFGALLGTAAGILLAATDSSDMPKTSLVVQSALIGGAVWMGMGAVTGSVLQAMQAQGARLSGVLTGCMQVGVLVAGIGVAFTLFGCFAQALLLEHSNPWGMNNNDPNLGIIGGFLIAGLVGVGVSVAGFLVWAAVDALRSRPGGCLTERQRGQNASSQSGTRWR